MYGCVVCWLAAGKTHYYSSSEGCKLVYPPVLYRPPFIPATLHPSSRCAPGPKSPPDTSTPSPLQKNSPTENRPAAKKSPPGVTCSSRHACPPAATGASPSGRRQCWSPPPITTSSSRARPVGSSNSSPNSTTTPTGSTSAARSPSETAGRPPPRRKIKTRVSSLSPSH